jgi:protein phosphatase 2C-like protein
LHILADAFFLQKAGNTENEFEDAFWPRTTIDSKAKLFRFAVADGATETSFSGLWARLLVREYCRGHFSSRKVFRRHLSELQQKWFNACSSKPLPWYAEAKLQQGAYSSLLGFTLAAEGPEKDGTWHALAIGDSCLFQVRREALVTAFPFEHSSQFNSRPVLLTSLSNINEEIVAAFQSLSSRWEAGDSFYLMTDAIAAWFLKATESRGLPWQILRDLNTHCARDFGDWVSDLRARRQIRNDDVTVLRIDTAF